MYEPRHKARLAIKPGITGMWQVSGRSDITDFEEVVRLDKEYIENWDIGLDIKILLKTVMVVAKYSVFDIANWFLLKGEISDPKFRHDDETDCEKIREIQRCSFDCINVYLKYK